MNRLVAYRYRLYPNKAQQTLLNKTMGSVRYFWNQQVATFKTYDKETNPKPEFKTSTELRNEIEWMQEVSAAAIQQKEIDFKEYRKQLFSKSRKKKIGFPSFKKKNNRQSFRLPNQKFKIIGNKIQLEKIGKVKIVVDRKLPDGKLMSVTVSKNPSGQYFASILIETEINYKPKTNKEVGIDLGIKTFSTQSDGVEIDNPKFLRKNQAKLRRMQQHLSRKQKGSNRRNRCRLKIAKLHQKVTNQRDWFLHNYSTSLISSYDRIYIEDLNVSGMVKNHCLAGAISDVGWSKFTSMLVYKAEWYGKDVVKVGRFYASSKTCECGVKNDNLKLSDREWVCEACGLINQRDELAANNILKEGRRSLGDITNAEAEVTKPVKRLELSVIN
ncbi:MAG: RNA-guided endonuclease TnpB family protein [Methanolobus sp.]|nr:RNA-guided endonuclease TnpB family protein [Methanolobus sp.]